MKITADTNVLIRAAVQDNDKQARQAGKILGEAALVAVPLPVLCEFVWVLSRGYKMPANEIYTAIHNLMHASNVVMNRPAVETGLSHLEAGGDFADAVIAYEGNLLGAEEFISFDKDAVTLLKEQGKPARCLT